MAGTTVTGPKRSAAYFEQIRQFLVGTLGEQAAQAGQHDQQGAEPLAAGVQQVGRGLGDEALRALGRESVADVMDRRGVDDALLAATASARQAQILAATPGPARITPGFALKAQIDARVHDYWRRREGAVRCGQRREAARCVTH